MGLDVVAFKNAKPTSDEDAYYAVQTSFRRMDGFKEGLYTGESEFHFRAGSYSGYNQWREWLCNKFLKVGPTRVWDNPKAFEGKPFVELINFADNEGAFGPKTSAKLLEDFNAHAEELDGEDEWDKAKYQDWRKAFELASENGLVILC